MKVFEEIRDKVFYHYLDFVSPAYIDSDNVIVTIACPRCGREIDIERPDDDPPTGKNRCESWCYMCGGRFEYFY